MIRVVLVLLLFFASPATLWGFYSTSSSFNLRQNISWVGEGSYTTSTSFKLLQGGGLPAMGISTSTNYELRSGFFQNINKSFKPAYTQIHYHWRNDDGSETTATSKTASSQDTSTSNVSKGSTIRLRVEISNEGGTQASYSAQQFRLEYGVLSTACSAIAAWTQVGANGAHWAMSDSANLTNGNNTTNIAVSAGGVSDANASFLSSNAGIRDTSSDTGNLSISSDSFAEIEYSIAAATGATDSATYCFRVTNAGSTSLFTYSVYPQATLAAATLSIVVDSNTEAFPSLTPGVAVSTSTLLTITTSNASGFTVSLARDTTAATMDLDSNASITIPDKTDWWAPSATTTIGNSTIVSTESRTLQFRVKSSGTDTANYSTTWWGTNDTAAAALYAGVPSTTQAIIKRSEAAVSGSSAQVFYNLDVPSSQRTGNYSGSVTYTVVANP